MQGFTVTPKELLDAAARCRATNDQVQGQITKMRNYVTGLMASYRGPAAVALQQLSDQWHADANSLSQVLGTIATGLTSNANSYVHNDTVNAGNLTSIAAGLPAARI